MGGVCKVVVVDFVGGKVDGNGFCAFCDDGFYQESGGAEVELVFEREAGFVGGMDVVMGLEDGRARDGGGVEGCIPSWEELVAETEGLGDDFFVGRAGEVGFAAAGVDVGVPAEEGVECAGLVPAGKEFFGRVAEETADVGAGEGEAGDVVG